LITVLIIGTIALIPAGFVGTEFFSQADRGELSLQIDLASSTPLKQTNQIVAQVEKIILQHQEVENIFSNVGTQQGTTIGTDATSNSNLAEISVVLSEKNKRTVSTADFGKKIRDEISVIPGIKPTIKLVGMTGNSMFDIQLAVKGSDMDSIAKGAAILKNIVTDIPGTDFVQYSNKDAKTQISIKLNRDKLSKMGLSVNDIGTTIQYAFKGDNNTKFKDKGDEYKINLQLNDGDKKDINSIKKLNIYTPNGNTVALEEIADIYESVGQSILERKNRLNSIGVNAATVGRPAGTVMQEIQQKLNNVTLPKGIIVSQEGMSKNQKDSFVSLFEAIGIAILLMYLIMVALYESVVYPFVVMFSLPVAIIGAIMALALTLNSINLFSLLGIIMLLGLVAKNAILIVDFTNQEKQKGFSVTDTLLAAGKERLRPILMTTFSMIFGMLPMALATGASSETKNAMAWVIIGGLTSSMIFTLVLVPCVYMVIEKARVRFNSFFHF
jgi:HAE1 family hydrophobic/amphiphilic exporter-1